MLILACLDTYRKKQRKALKNKALIAVQRLAVHVFVPCGQLAVQLCLEVQGVQLFLDTYNI
jgi:hypothetical protein